MSQEHGSDPQSAVETAASLEAVSDARAQTRLGTVEGGVVDSLPSGPAKGFFEQLGGEIGRYQLLEEVGRGAMGVVFSAYDKRLDRRVAVKVLRRGENAETALREGRALAKLRSPNVVQVYDAGEHDGRIFLAMEFVVGQTLGEWLETNRSTDEIVRVFLAIALGLADAHAADLIHRDVKPDNIMVTEAGRVLVMDFGLAVEHEDAMGGAGTLAYMSPEQVRRDPLGPESDQFSFFVALFEALEGKRPFTGESVAMLATAIDDARLAPGALGDAPRWLRKVVSTGLAAQAKHRHASMAKVARLLERGLGRRRRALALLAGSAAVTATLGFVLAPSAAQQSCRNDAAQMQAWADGLDAEIGPRFREELGADGNQAWSITLRGFTEFADEWTRVYGEVCAEGFGRKRSLSTKVVRGRLACLGDQRAFVRSLAESTEGRDAEGLTAIRAASTELPRPGRCLDEEGALAEGDTSKRLRMLAANEGLARARGRWEAAQPKRALAQLDAVEGSLVGVEAPRLLSEMATLRGHVLADEGQERESTLAHKEAVEHATASGDLYTMGNAWAARIQQEQDETLDPERVDVLLEALRPILAQTSDSNLLAVGNILEGDVQRMRSDLDAAQQFYVRAASIAESDPDAPRHLKTRIHNRLAIVLARKGDRVAARKEFVLVKDLAVATFGENHQRAFNAEANIATICLDMGDNACARERFEGLLNEPKYNNRGPVLAHLGRLEAEEGNLELAEERLRESIEVLSKRHGPRAPQLSSARLELYNVLHTARRYEEALTQAEELVAIADSVTQEPNRKSGFAYHALGGALLNLGRYEEARVAYARALEIRRSIESVNARLASSMLGVANAQYELGEVEASIHTTANALALSDIDPIDRAGARLELARRAPDHPLAKRLAVEALHGYLVEREPDRARRAYELLQPAP